MLFRIFLFVLVLLPVLAHGNQMEAAVVDGMTLSLGDHVQNIEVRAKFFGPGFCGVRIRVAGNDLQFLAPLGL
jgi:hypothetical protein